MVAASLFVPFWLSRIMHRESLLFIADAAGEPATATLLFPPDESVTLCGATGEALYAEGRDYTGEALYAEGRDYTIDKATGRVRLTPGSRIPFLTRAELYPSADQDESGFMHVRGNPARFMLFAEGDFFHSRQVAATYRHATDLWRGLAPSFMGVDLPRTLERLRRRDPVAVCLIGDSISEGYNASGFVGVPPHQPAYGPLVAAGLEHVYGSELTLGNVSSAGWTSNDGLETAERMVGAQPDMVIIAFGMNDAGFAEASEFTANVHSIMDGIRRRAPTAEFILVSPMLPHPDWHYTRIERFPAYRDALAGLCGSGIVLADLTRLWGDVLARKSVYDLTGNGINHPNDFGHRLYAQAILSLLVQRDGWRSVESELST